MIAIGDPWRATRIRYNDLNKISKVTTPDGTVLEYRYDPGGERIAKLINSEVVERYYGAIEIKNPIQS